MTNLTPAPDIRVTTTLPELNELSPEAKDGRLAGKTGNINVGAGGSAKVPVFEQPWWQHAVKCLALRMTYEETAKFCDVSDGAVRQALRSPIFQARLREQLEKATTPLVELFQSSGVAAYQKIVELMDSPKASAAVQLASAKEIIERNLGKAPQLIKHDDNALVGDPVEIVASLKAQNDALRKQLPN